MYSKKLYQSQKQKIGIPSDYNPSTSTSKRLIILPMHNIGSLHHDLNLTPALIPFYNITIAMKNT